MKNDIQVRSNSRVLAQLAQLQSMAIEDMQKRWLELYKSGTPKANNK